MNLHECSSKFHVAHSAVHVYLEKLGYSLFTSYMAENTPMASFVRFHQGLD